VFANIMIYTWEKQFRLKKMLKDHRTTIEGVLE